MFSTSLGTKPSYDHKALLHQKNGQDTELFDKANEHIVDLLTGRQETE